MARTRLFSRGIAPRYVAMAINVLGGGMDVAKYNDIPGDGECNDVRLKAGEGQVMRPADLNRIHVRAANGEMIRLDNLARLKTGVDPATISRYDLQYAANFYVTPAVPEGDTV